MNVNSFLTGSAYLKPYVISCSNGDKFVIYGQIYILYDRLRPHIPLHQYIDAPYIKINLPGKIGHKSFVWFWIIFNGIPEERMLFMWKKMTYKERLEVWSYIKWFSATYMYRWYYTHLLDGFTSEIMDLDGFTSEIMGLDGFTSEIMGLDNVINTIPWEEKIPINNIVHPFDVAYSKVTGKDIIMTPGMMKYTIRPVQGSRYHSLELIIIVENLIFHRNMTIKESDEIQRFRDLGDSIPTIWKNGITYLIRAEDIWYIVYEGKSPVNITSSIKTYKESDEVNPWKEIIPGTRLDSPLNMRMKYPTPVSILTERDFFNRGVFRVNVGDVTLYGDPLIMRSRSFTIDGYVEDMRPFLEGDKVDKSALLMVWSYMNGVKLNISPVSWDQQMSILIYINYFQIPLVSRFVEDFLYNLLDLYATPERNNEMIYRKLVDIMKRIPRDTISSYETLTGRVIDHMLAKIFIPTENMFLFNDKYRGLVTLVSNEDIRTNDIVIAWGEEQSLIGKISLLGTDRMLFAVDRSTRFTITYERDKPVVDVMGEAFGTRTTMIRNNEIPRFRYINGSKRRYNDEIENVTSIRFPTFHNWQHVHKIVFESPVTEKKAILEAEKYLSVLITQEYYENVINNLVHNSRAIRVFPIPWQKAMKAYRTRGDLLGGISYIFEIINTNGVLSMQFSGWE